MSLIHAQFDEGEEVNISGQISLCNIHTRHGVKYRSICIWKYLNTFFRYLYLNCLKWKVFVIVIKYFHNVFEISNTFLEIVLFYIWLLQFYKVLVKLTNCSLYLSQHWNAIDWLISFPVILQSDNWLLLLLPCEWLLELWLSMIKDNPQVATS